MSAPSEYEDEIRAVKEAVPDADETAIAEEFKRYQNEFLIPPKEALRSVLKKFQTEAGMEVTPVASGGGGGGGRPAAKSVDRFSALGNDDANVTIEVEVITYTPRMQVVRGEERQIGFGWIEDNPWEDGGERTRWDFKDWGPHTESLAPGSVVRLEGVSVNEWNGKRSLNINQSSRVAVLRAGDRKVIVAPSEPVPIERALTMDGFASVVGRVITSREVTINRKDGTTSDVVKGRIADDTGSIGFTSWGPFEHAVGTLLKIEGVNIRRWRDTPELSIGDRTKIEVFHDTSFATLEDLEEASLMTIGKLRDGARDIHIVVQLTSWSHRDFTGQDGSEKQVWSGDVVDPTGACRLSVWEEAPISAADLPIAIKLTNARVRAWQGSPDLTIDNAAQLEVLDAIPWEVIDPADHAVEVPFHELISGSSRSGIASEATVISVASGSGIIHRCPDCRKVLRDGACRDHGPREGVEDLRLRLILDDGIQNGALILGRDTAEAFLGRTMKQVADAFSADGGESFVNGLRAELIGRRHRFTGRAIIDAQDALLMGDSFAAAEQEAPAAAEAVRDRWGVHE